MRQFAHRAPSRAPRISPAHSPTSALSGASALEELRAAVPTASLDFFAADYTRRDQLDALFAHIARVHGCLDIVCHTTMTEGGGPRPFMEPTSDYWPSAVSSIFLSLLDVTQRAVPMMMERGGGAIMSFASDAAKVATPGEAVLVGARAGGQLRVRAGGGPPTGAAQYPIERRHAVDHPGHQDL